MAKFPVQRLVPWAVVGLLALTAVLVVEADGATAQPTTTGGGSTPTASGTTGPSTSGAPTSTITASPTGTPQPWGQTDPCQEGSSSGAQYISVALTSPANGSVVRGTITVAGTITKLPGAPEGVPENILSIVSAVGTQPQHWQGEGDFSFPWQSDDGRLPDVKIAIVVSSFIENLGASDRACVHLNNGFQAGIGSGGSHADPFYVSQGDLMYFYSDLRGESTFLPDTAVLALSIDGSPIVNLQVTPVAWSVATGGYYWELSTSYAYRTFHGYGQHQFLIDLTLHSNMVTWHKAGASGDGFHVLHADYPTATASGTTSAGATPTAYGTTGYPTGAYGTPYASGTPTWATTTPPTTTTYDAEPVGNSWIDPSAIGFSSVRPLPGERVTIYVRVQNPVDTPVDGTITIFDAKPDGQSDIVLKQNMQLDGHQYEIVSAPWTPAAEGDHLVSAIFTDNSPEGKHIPDTAISKSRIYVGDGQTQTPILVMSAGLINIGTMEEGQTRTVPVVVTAYNQYLGGVRVLALDPGGVKVRSLTPPTDLAPGQSATYYLQVEVPELGANQSLGSQRLIVMARAESVSSNVESLSLVVHKEGFAGLPYINTNVALVAVAGTGAATAFFRRRGGNPPV